MFSYNINIDLISIHYHHLLGSQTSTSWGSLASLGKILTGQLGSVSEKWEIDWREILHIFIRNCEQPLQLPDDSELFPQRVDLPDEAQETGPQPRLPSYWLPAAPSLRRHQEEEEELLAALQDVLLLQHQQQDQVVHQEHQPGGLSLVKHEATHY